MRGATAGTDGASGYVAKPAAGQEAYMLLGDGTWGAQPIAGLPSQTSNSGKLLTTDGTNAAWTTTGVLTSLTAPASTDLTLSGGSSGASLVLGHTSGASMSSASKLNLTNSEASVGSTSGALRVTGGIYAGAASVFGGSVNIAQGQTLTLNATNSTSAAIYVAQPALAGISQWGARILTGITSTATNDGVGIETGVTTAGGAWTMGSSYGILINGLSRNNTAVTTNYGLRILDQSAGGTNYSIYTGAGVARFGDSATFAGAVTIAGTVIHTLSATPASASATGTVGTMSWDANYIYICTAANTWKRVAIATW